MKNSPQKHARFARLSLLKAPSAALPDSPLKAKLESFGNVHAGRDYEVTFYCQEFTSLCPVTGQPDFGVISIRYVPGKFCLESKALKLFLFSFRNFNTFHEEAVNIILERIEDAISPKWIEVKGEFRPRGGISISVKAVHSRKGFPWK